MKVTVVGSYSDDLSKRNGDGTLDEKGKEVRPKFKVILKQFQDACVGIGKALAEGDHRLIVAHAERKHTAEALALTGFQQISKQQFNFSKCFHHPGDAQLKAHLDAVEESDVVILIGGADGTYASGLSALLRRKVIIPIPIFGGSAKDLCEIPEINKVVEDRIRNLNPESANWIKALTGSIQSVLNTYPRVLIIHGRGDDGKELQNKIKAAATPTDSKLHGLAEAQIMDLTGKGALSVPQVFEELASEVSAAIVIVTADDIGGFARNKGPDTVPATSLKLEVRARENVWVEVGWFWGRLGRGKIFLWLKDEVKIPSDLSGVALTTEPKLEPTKSGTPDELGKTGGAWVSIESFLCKMRNNAK